MGGFAAIFLLVAGALAAYDSMSDSRAMGDKWDMMQNMGDMRGMMGGGNGTQTTGSASGTGHVTISGFRSEPTVLTVTPGTVVSWTNNDSAPHTATARDQSFDTSRLNSGDESSQVKFDTRGTFEYFCTYHQSMVGRVVVTTGR